MLACRPTGRGGQKECRARFFVQETVKKTGLKTVETDVAQNTGALLFRLFHWVYPSLPVKCIVLRKDKKDEADRRARTSIFI